MADQTTAAPAHANGSTTGNANGGATTIPSGNEQHTEEGQALQERAVGITAYVSPDAPGFSGILKQRYTDFLVNEIVPSGQVLHLTDIAGPPDNRKSRQQQRRDGNENGGEADAGAEAGRKRQAEDAATEQESKRVKVEEKTDAPAAKDAATEAQPAPEVSDEDKATLASIFGSPTTDAILKLYADVHAYPKRKPREHTTLESELIPEKSKRTEAHVAIRRIFNSRLETAMLQEKPGALSIKAAPPRSQQRGGRTDVPENANGARQKGRVQWDELGGQYLHFTLYKENKDTMEVLFFIASQLKVKVSSNFTFAGTKDRRGVTVQRVAAYRIRQEQIMGLTRMAKGWKVGAFEYKKHGLELGELKGNEFVITLRDCQLSQEPEQGLDARQRLEKMRSAVKTAADHFRDHGFINYYGLQRFGSFSTGTHAIGMKILQGDLEGAIDGILAYQPSLLSENHDADNSLKVPEEDMKRATAIKLWRGTGDSRRALEMMPRRFQAETSIIQFLGRRGRDKSLIQARDWQGALSGIQRNLRLMYVHAYQSFIWNTAAGKRREIYGDKVVHGDLVIVGEKNTIPSANAPQQKAEMDQDGELVVRPTGDDAAPTEDAFTRARHLSKQEAESGDYNIFDVVLPLPGWDVQYPSNETGKFYEQLMASAEGGGLDPHNMRRSWKDASLAGGYRKVMSRPGNFSAEVTPYANELDQLVSTDAEKLMKQGRGQEEEEGKDRQVTEGDRIAVVVRMQLASSQYATMALRELTKGGAVGYRPEFAAVR